MGVVIEKVEWEPKPIVHLFLFASCFASIFLLPFFSKNSTSASASSVFNVGPSAPFLRFQRSFLLLYSLASVIGGLESVFGEHEYQYYGVSREQMALCLSAGVAASLFIGTFLGILSDLIGPRKACMMFCILHLFVGVLKIVTKHPSVWITSVCLAIACSIFSFSFETWMVTEHEKQGHRQDLLTDTFWLMTFFESAALIFSQVFANLLVRDHEKGIFFPSAPAALLAMISILYIRKEWNGCRHTSTMRDYRNSFYVHILSDKKIWILACAQASMHFSFSIFWIMWAPTIVADGREVHLSLIYPCFLGSRMLGSTAVSWLLSGASPLFNEDCLAAAFLIAGFALSIVAYDYQEIGVLVTLFCIYHACAGLIFPSLARLRTMYVPNELRGGMISLSSLPANAAVLFVLIQGGYYRNLSNATIMALSAFGMFTAAGCIHALKRWGKQSRQNWHKL